MGDIGWVFDHLGLTIFTLVSLTLVIYLGYSMLYPERF
ncbi:MAG: potassium-transporting ATPase subunit F [Thermoplasmata archaeon]|nr:potassium-transporting ATPase subunit F [Thermoplasmata archaeon]